MQLKPPLPFGPYTWQVLEIRNDKALVIAEEILQLRWYHDAFAETTWATCALRKFLNGEFFHAFGPKEKARIVPVNNPNPDNPWFHTPGGEDTVDHIFLLSLEEVCTYFGDSTAKLRDKGNEKWLIDDENNPKRQTVFQGKPHGWRLRSPGYYAKTAASVNAQGQVYVRGSGVFGRPKDGGGIRPALWLRM